MEGATLAGEVIAGLLRKVVDRHPGSEHKVCPMTVSNTTLDKVPRQWHFDGAALNCALDDRFVGGRR